MKFYETEGTMHFLSQWDMKLYLWQLCINRPTVTALRQVSNKTSSTDDAIYINYNAKAQFNLSYEHKVHTEARTNLLYCFI